MPGGRSRSATFTGYSALCIARALPDDGTAAVLRRERGVDGDRSPLLGRGRRRRPIELRLGPAIDTLRALPREEQFDVAFVDADKSSYSAYVDEIVPRLAHGRRHHGGQHAAVRAVCRPHRPATKDTVAIRAFNDVVAADDRLRSVLLPISDGFTLLQKR